MRIHLNRGDVAAARTSLANLRQMGDTFASSRPQEAYLTWIEGMIAEIEDGDCSRALASYDRASTLSPLGALYRASRLRCLTTLGRWKDAETEVAWLLERIPGNARYRLDVARYHVARGQTDEATTHLEAALGFWSEADADYIPAREARALLAELRRS